MSIADFLKKHEENTFVLKHHPLIQLESEVKEDYLMALALVVFADGDAAEEEVELLKLLTRSFGIEEDFVEDCIDFGMNPNSTRMKTIEKSLKLKKLHLPFIADAFAIGYVSQGLSQKEEEVITLLRKLSCCDQKIFDLGKELGEAIADKDNAFFDPECGKSKAELKIELFASEYISLSKEEEKNVQSQVSKDFVPNAKEFLDEFFSAMGINFSECEESEVELIIDSIKKGPRSFIKLIEDKGGQEFTEEEANGFNMVLTLRGLDYDFNLTMAKQNVLEEKSEIFRKSISYIFEIGTFIEKHVRTKSASPKLEK